MKTEIIPIDRYEAVVKSNGVEWFAIKGKERIPMPDCYSEMYTDSFLAIMERELEIPEIFEGATDKHYIPLFTGSKEKSE